MAARCGAAKTAILTMLRCRVVADVVAAAGDDGGVIGRVDAKVLDADTRDAPARSKEDDDEDDDEEEKGRGHLQRVSAKSCAGGREREGAAAAAAHASVALVTVAPP